MLFAEWRPHHRKGSSTALMVDAVNAKLTVLTQNPFGRHVQENGNMVQGRVSPGARPEAIAVSGSPVRE